MSSSDQAKKYHSVTFGTKNTWDDWGLIPKERPSVALPDLIETTVDGDTTDGEVDTTEVFGEPMYGLAKGSMTFYIVNPGSEEYAYHQWIKDRSAILGYLHNRRRTMVLDDDPDHYYEGRFQVSFKGGKNYSEVTIDYALDTYRESL